MSREYQFCRICRDDHQDSLVRLAWVDGPQGRRLVVVQTQSDTVVCLDCIRRIKRTPFSELKSFRMDTTGGKTNEPIDDDLPF